MLESDTQGYTKIRAIVSKATAMDKIKKPSFKLSKSDLILLSSSYTYLYSQRLGTLFDRCHAALWNVFEKQGDTTQLMRLFRHSSFVWRIRGNEKKETNYLNRLSKKVPQTSNKPQNLNVSSEINYFFKRFNLITKK